MARKTNPVEVSVENLCVDVLGEDVREVVVCSDLQHADDAFMHQALNEEVLQFDVFCFL